MGATGFSRRPAGPRPGSTANDIPPGRISGTQEPHFSRRMRLHPSEHRREIFDRAGEALTQPDRRRPVQRCACPSDVWSALPRIVGGQRSIGQTRRRAVCGRPDAALWRPRRHRRGRSGAPDQTPGLGGLPLRQVGVQAVVRRHPQGAATAPAAPLTGSAGVGPIDLHHGTVAVGPGRDQDQVLVVLDQVADLVGLAGRADLQQG